MNNYSGPSDTQNSKEFSDDAIRRFLLGRLNSIEQTIFEERLFADEAFEARVRLAELDLTDDYAFARLNTTDRELFEQEFLVSVDRQRALKVSTALRDRFAAASSIGWQPAIAERVRLLFGLNRSSRRYAFAALMLILLIATVWLVTKEPQLVTRVLPTRAPSNPKTSPKSKEAQHPSGPTSQTHQESLPEKPIHGDTIFIIVLRVNDKPTIILSGNDRDTVRMQLMLETLEEGNYQAELLTAEGQPVFSAEDLKAADGVANDFDVPASLLKAGDYQIKLIRIGEASTKSAAGTYYFRVQ